MFLTPGVCLRVNIGFVFLGDCLIRGDEQALLLADNRYKTDLC